jgi:sirohydrochlorin cobaltochelatase
LATILLGHGARDPRWAEPFGRLRDAVAFALPGVDVSLAFLELMTPDVHAAAATAIAAGCTQITVVPIFFGVGAHVRRDLPERLAVLRATHPGIVFTLADAAGEDASVLNALAAYCIRVATSD